MTVRRALLSAYDKTDVLGFAQELHRLGVELVASGGTAELIAGDGIPVTPVAELTGFAEMLGHRVVTLHPAIHGGILARRDVPEDAAELEQHGIAPIDLVYVNLYPFERTVGRLDVEWADAIEQIDVGGPAMLRAAAKNHAFVVPLCRPEDFAVVLEQLRASGDVDLETRRTLAARAFARTGSYDAAVASWFTRDEPFPETLLPVFDLETRCRVRREPPPGGRVLRRARRADAPPLPRRSAAGQAALVQQPQRPLGGPAARRRVRAARVRDRQAREPVRGRARGHDRGGLREGARGRSHFRLRRGRGRQRAGQRGARRDARRAVHRGALRSRATTRSRSRRSRASRIDRVLVDNERRAFTPGERDLTRVIGGMLAQERDVELDPLDAMDVACGDLDAEGWEELLFAWAVVRHVTLECDRDQPRDRQTLGIGAGQMSRVDAVRIAIEKARERGHDLAGAVARLRRLLPLRRRRAARARRGHHRVHPARRLEARCRGRRRRARCRCDDGPHGPPPLPALAQAAWYAGRGVSLPAGGARSRFDLA